MKSPDFKLLLRLSSVFLFLFGVSSSSLIAYAQSGTEFPLFQCPSAQTVRTFVSSVSTILFMSMLVIIIFLIVFNIFGFISNVAMRLGEFFNERIRFVFELLFIYVLFLMNFDPNTMIGDIGGCATINYTQLFNNGALFYRFVGWILRMLGISF